jgi:hypothetical protein
MEGTRFWLALFAVSQLMIMIIGNLPLFAWRSAAVMQGASLSKGPTVLSDPSAKELPTPGSRQSFGAGAS